MPTNDFDEKDNVVVVKDPKSHSTAIAVLAVGLVAALAGDGYLLVRANHDRERHPDADLEIE
jgi:hypothetical protein